MRHTPTWLGIQLYENSSRLEYVGYKSMMNGK